MWSYLRNSGLCKLKENKAQFNSLWLTEWVIRLTTSSRA